MKAGDTDMDCSSTGDRKSSLNPVRLQQRANHKASPACRAGACPDPPKQAESGSEIDHHATSQWMANKRRDKALLDLK